MNKKNDKIFENIFTTYPDIVNVEQMCEMLGGICTKTGCKLLKENKIEHFKISRKYYIPKIHILTYLNLINQSDE